MKRLRKSGLRAPKEVGSRVADEPFHVSEVTPVLLYCAGGLETTVHGEVLRKERSDGCDLGFSSI